MIRCFAKDSILIIEKPKVSMISTAENYKLVWRHLENFLVNRLKMFLIICEAVSHQLIVRFSKIEKEIYGKFSYL